MSQPVIEMEIWRWDSPESPYPFLPLVSTINHGVQQHCHAQAYPESPIVNVDIAESHEQSFYVLLFCYETLFECAQHFR